MQSLNSVNSLQSSAMVFVLPLDNSATTSNSQTSQSSKALQDVIEQLIQALTKNGQLDESSPLGKMLAKAMAANGHSGGGVEDMKAALDSLIHEKLGANFGASADSSAGTAAGTGTDTGGGSGLGSSAGTGQSDLMTQVLNGLGKSLLDDLLTKQSNGTNFSQDDMPMLEKIAQFMDDNKTAFPTPDSGSWMNELKEDNFLDGNETAQFRSALDIISQQLGKQQSDASAAGGGLGSPVSDSATVSGALADPGVDTNLSNSPNANGNQDLGHLLGALVERGLQSVLSGGGLGTPVNNTPQLGTPSDGNTSNQDLGQLLGGLIEKGLQASLQGNGGGGSNGASDLQSSAAQTAALIVNALLQGTHNQAVA